MSDCRDALLERPSTRSKDTKNFKICTQREKGLFFGAFAICQISKAVENHWTDVSIYKAAYEEPRCKYTEAEERANVPKVDR